MYQPGTKIVLALTTAEGIDLAIAGATFCLALATVYMARYVRGQAKETGRLANLTEAGLEAASKPILRIMRLDDAEHVDVVTVNEGQPSEKLVALVENHGLATAEPESFYMDPGGQGRLAETGKPESPVIEPGTRWSVDFDPSPEDKAAHAEGAEVLVQIVYLAIRSGLRYRMQTYIKRDDDKHGERWAVVREVGPERLGLVAKPTMVEARP